MKNSTTGLGCVSGDVNEELFRREEQGETCSYSVYAEKFREAHEHFVPVIISISQEATKL
jgi:hypothetical protein